MTVAIRRLMRTVLARRDPRTEARPQSAEADLSIHRLQSLPRLLNQGRANDCGPYALAMAEECLRPSEVDRREVARAIRWSRVPRIGATLPWGIVYGARRAGFAVRAGWLGDVAEIKRCVDRGHPAVVLLHPDDFAGCRWYALHYRVVVGYRDDPKLPGGGELFLACSAAPSAGIADAPGNVVLSYARFARQWRTWLTPRWHAELSDG